MEEGTPRMKTAPLAIAAAAAMTLGLAACERPTGTAPANSEVGAAMPDTSTARNPDRLLTAPDAGATGAVPAEGQPAVAPTPPVGTAGGSQGVTGAAERPVAPGER